jgi:A/G-specific adenine glycosylase
MNFKFLRNKLSEWYELNKRDLPWRDTKDPYKIWLSEIILQQTQVKQGLSYYYKFVTNYPSIEDLAYANEDNILRDWQGLGYYSRARNLHSAAKTIVKDSQGEFPKTYQEIIKLRGIGPYTAAAISSFAFSEVKAVVDGNVSRVIARLFGIEEAINQGFTPKQIQNHADDFIDPKKPDIHNQAIMELGATVCTPKSPDCDSCPLESECRAKALGLQKVIPKKIKKIKIKERYLIYVVIESKDKILMKKRTEKDIWAGLFDFPSLEISVNSEDSEILGISQINALQKVSILNVGISDWKKHVLSHQRIWAKFIILHSQSEMIADHYDFLKGSKFYFKSELQELGKPILIVNFLKDFIL